MNDAQKSTKPHFSADLTTRNIEDSVHSTTDRHESMKSCIHEYMITKENKLLHCSIKSVCTVRKDSVRSENINQ